MPSTLPALLLLSFFLSHPPATTTARPDPKKDDHQVTIKPSNPRSPWYNFTHLLGAEPGRELAGTSELKRYLTRFGYLPTTTTNFTDSFDSPLSSAVAHYQSNHGLHTTGRVGTVEPHSNAERSAREIEILLRKNGMLRRKLVTQREDCERELVFEGRQGKWIFM